ncbi:hypothetical protein MPTK1_3g07490 [Marchantia polymorpha subsp. ruderalis]|uniref:Uncharacterized protein n=2 Tax=Marchantia polymorpha TaxID=3197 RepID=A0AAF6AYD8_MARPO|nr:hypothetical protein MARPO_0006s0224 [Marchantia polymorpha]BBN04772.1 hypothetical protein Mp_3g07490 [Marchantia polymorpha subsp. ruderalis]|eukprot:PTQ48218.1 hypothetical protein MARPO_0006s0224 [Marchantia polymorpha]
MLFNSLLGDARPVHGILSSPVRGLIELTAHKCNSSHAAEYQLSLCHGEARRLQQSTRPKGFCLQEHQFAFMRGNSAAF